MVDVRPQSATDHKIAAALAYREAGIAVIRVAYLEEVFPIPYKAIRWPANHPVTSVGRASLSFYLRGGENFFLPIHHRRV